MPRTSQEYLDLFARMRRELFQQKPYFAVHWRRGDQLITKCKAANRDRSVNCQNVEGLKQEMSRRMRPEERDWPVYVATNEQEPWRDITGSCRLVSRETMRLGKKIWLTT
eukprot:Skav208316  [mRNA]  locus=scaffold897:561660:562910:+ [translate_table: standard]